MNTSPLLYWHISQAIWKAKQNVVITSGLIWDLAIYFGKVTNINLCLSSNLADVLVSLLNKDQAQVIVISGRYRKTTYWQIQEVYKWLELRCWLHAYITSDFVLRTFLVLHLCWTEYTVDLNTLLYGVCVTVYQNWTRSMGRVLNLWW
jgi:hypothetical protein